MKTFSLNKVAAALDIVPMTASKWLVGLGISNGHQKGIEMKLDRADCIALAVCSRLSGFKQLDFEDAWVDRLFRVLRDATPEQEKNYRKASVALLSGNDRKIAFTGPDDLTAPLIQPFPRDSILWVGQSEVTLTWVCKADLAMFHLGPIYETVDEMFLDEQELAEKKDPWLKFGVASEVK